MACAPCLEMVVTQPQTSLGWSRTHHWPVFYAGGGVEIMSKAVITSYTLLDFLSEGDMLAFFTFVE